MNDEKLEEILQQALTPTVTDEDIYMYKRVRKHSMKNIIKTGVVVAACAALVMAANISGVLDNLPTTKLAQNNDGTAAESSKNPFKLTCYAAELKKGKMVPVSLKGEENWGFGLCGVENDPNGVSYCIGNQFKCEGENIANITYSINSGCFYIVEKKSAGIVTEYNEYSGPELATPIMGFDDLELEEGEDESDSIYNIIRASSYTVSYDAQESATSMFGICGIKSDAKAYKAAFSDIPLEDQIDGYTELMDGVEITCTVTFTDGTMESKVITVKGYKEESVIKKEDGSNKPYYYAGFAYKIK